MSIDVLIGILIPFVGTALGAACVFFLKDQIPALVQKGLLGFASGVMVAASVWSLLIPSMNLSADLGRLAFLPAVTGFFCGILFLLFLCPLKLIDHALSTCSSLDNFRQRSLDRCQVFSAKMERICTFFWIFLVCKV